MKNLLFEIVHFRWVYTPAFFLFLLAGTFCAGQVDPTLPITPDPVHEQLNGCPPPSFYFCDPATMTPAELVSCNRSIALTYAPEVNQFMSTCYENDANGDADRLLKVNFDGNWDATDNWENVDDVSTGSNFSHFGSDAYPNAYYAVLWTARFWIITYSYYYPRDWAEDLFCGEDEHENDLTRTMLVIKRPKTMNETPASLLVGYVVGNHDGADIRDCVPSANLNISTPCQGDGTSTYGVHLKIWSASGSHATHDDMFDGYNDPPDGNPCRICKDNKLIDYFPSATPSVPVLCPGPGQCPLNCDWGGLDNCALGLSNVLGTVHRESYGLIDNFNPSEGLWAQRDNPLIFGQGGDYENQHFVCTNGNGCSGWNVSIFGQQVLFGDKFASAPWQGGVGLNPIPYLQSGDLATLDCNCYLPASGCTPTSFSDQEYILNPYLCDYEILPRPGYGGGIPITPSGIAVSIDALSDFKSTSGLTGINWTITTTPANALTCNGCSTHQPNITLFSAQDPCAATGTITVHITASFVTPDCGEKMVERDLVFKKPGPIVPGSQLVITQTSPPCPFGYSGSYHVTPTNPNWTYSWHCLACQFTSATNGSEVWAKKASPSYVPIYTVTVSNGCGTSTSEEFQLGACSNLLGDGNQEIKLFPNPASGVIHCSLEGADVDGLPYQVQVYNQVYDLKYTQESAAPSWDVDVSAWPNGLYHLIVQQGNLVTTKTFLVQHGDQPLLNNNPR